MTNILSIPLRASLSVDETEDGGLLVCQIDGSGNESTILLYPDDAQALAGALSDWFAKGQQ